MEFVTNNNSFELMLLVAMFKAFHDAGITTLEKCYAKDSFDMDYFYDMILEALDCSAPIVDCSEGLYNKYGYDYEDCDVNIRAFSSKEMQKCFELAHKLDRLDKGSKMPQKYEKRLEKEMENLKTFYSYSFDWTVGNKRRGAQLEALWSYEFYEDIALCLWIVRVMKMCKKKLPELQKAYRDVRRKKRSMKSVKMGGAVCAA